MLVSFTKPLTTGSEAGLPCRVLPKESHSSQDSAKRNMQREGLVGWIFYVIKQHLDRQNTNVDTNTQVIALVALVGCQEKPRVGEDGRPLLNRPQVELCR